MEFRGPRHGVTSDVPFPTADVCQTLDLREVRECTADGVGGWGGVLFEWGGARDRRARLRGGSGRGLRAIGFLPAAGQPGLV